MCCQHGALSIYHAVNLLTSHFKREEKGALSNQSHPVTWKRFLGALAGKGCTHKSRGSCKTGCTTLKFTCNIHNAVYPVSEEEKPFKTFIFRMYRQKTHPNWGRAYSQEGLTECREHLALRQAPAAGCDAVGTETQCIAATIKIRKQRNKTFRDKYTAWFRLKKS